ncbi:hypothetical protein ACEWY4_005180 [Coilia grayii]|uniref:Golgi resident protein GCP60 n=1 Tax=Coilia grayii TaxID=363190 RepID=A0ABD1KHU4_9TELE
MAMEVQNDDVDNSSPQECTDSPKMTIEESGSQVELSPLVDRTENNSCHEKVARWSIDNNWGLSLEELFDMSQIFLKDKDGKAFHPTYEEKLRLVALLKQASQGPYDPEAYPEVGFFDVLGNDRRKEWASLGKMTKDDAKAEFIKLLNTCCRLFSPYITSHKIEKEEQEKKRREEEERLRLEREEREEMARKQLEEEIRQQQEEAKRRKEEEERSQMELQKQQIMAALNAQTSVQFQQYAAQHCPGDPEQQKLLIRQLQEQHYQQYIQQACQLQLAQQQQATLDMQQAECAALPPANTEPDSTPDIEHVNDHQSTNPPPQEETPASTPPGILAPSMWTRPQIKEFKQKMHDDPDSIITVGRGEVVTVRVPTNEDGSYMFWEFATDHYDIGFGLHFEWTDIPITSNSVGATSDPGDEDAGKGEAEGETVKVAQTPLVEEVVPIYRRDSHEEVYAGSHQYPGQGTYLLKFDNSYSLWRSKVVYYRVYYTR